MAIDTSARTGPGTGLPDHGPGRAAARQAGGPWRWGLASVGRALSISVPVLLLCSLVTFLLGAAAKQQPADLLLGDAATPEDIARLNHEFGLDRPVLVQYVDWLGHAVRGDFGTSWFTGIPVADSMVQRLPVSLGIAALALALAVVIGTSFGVAAAIRQGGLLDRTVTVVSSTIATIPPFVASIGLIVLFGVLFPVLPTGGYIDPSVDVGGWLRSIILPAIALSLEAAADIARQLRTGLVAALHENYAVGAMIRGFSRRRVLLHHVLRNGSGPAVAALGLQIPRLIGGAVITEAIFSLPGLGQLARDGAMRGDVPVVIGSLIVTVVIVLISSAVVNIVLGVLRPDTRRNA